MFWVFWAWLKFCINWCTPQTVDGFRSYNIPFEFHLTCSLILSLIFTSKKILRRTCKNTVFSLFIFSSSFFVVVTYSRRWLTFHIFQFANIIVKWNILQCIRRLKSHLNYFHIYIYIYYTQLFLFYSIQLNYVWI